MNKKFGCGILWVNAEVFVQSVIPIPAKNVDIASDVLCFNRMLVDICRTMKCRYMDILDRFLTRSREKRVNENLFRYDRRRDRVDLHLNYVGLGVLGRAFIRVIRDEFDPFVSC